MNTNKIAILGSEGFIGKNLTRHIIKTKRPKILTLISRKKSSFKKGKIRKASCDLLNITKLKKLIEGHDFIYFTGGLAWQHPKSAFRSKLELLLEQLVQNSLSAYFMGKIITVDQRLIWLSTNAIEIMKSSLTPLQNKKLENELNEIIECLFSRKKMDVLKSMDSYLKELTWDLVMKHVLYSFPHALDYSYAYSKYLGEKILIRLSNQNIKIVRISDAYGPGQSISFNAINPDVQARRIQRFVAAYRLISQNKIDWIPRDGKGLHGFHRSKDKRIFHEVWRDKVFPTYIKDICQTLTNVGESANKTQVLYQLRVEGLMTKELSKIIRDFFKASVNIKQEGIKRIDFKTKLKDSNPSVLMSKPTSFKDGLRKWMKNEV